MPPEPLPTRLQHVLIAYVKGHGVPQVVLAQRAGMTEKHVSQMLTGKTSGTLAAWDQLIRAAEEGVPQ